MFSTTSYSETVCLLSKLKSTCYIDVDLDLSELDVTQAETKATYDKIKSYVFEHTTLIEGGTPIDELSPSAQEKVHKYFTIKTRGSKITVSSKNKAIQEANKYHDYFVLISNKEKDPFECLRKYRKRETIESFLRQRNSMPMVHDYLFCSVPKYCVIS